MSHRIIKGVIHNFLGTYTSRYSDFDGYWLFGILVGDGGELRVNLLSSSEAIPDDAPVAAAKQLARQKFREQMDKAGFHLSLVQEAWVDITKLPDLKNGLVNGRMCAGYDLRFVVRVVLDSGKIYESEMTVFVAPHDSQIELRSNRVT